MLSSRIFTIRSTKATLQNLLCLKRTFRQLFARNFDLDVTTRKVGDQIKEDDILRSRSYRDGVDSYGMINNIKQCAKPQIVGISLN